LRSKTLKTLSHNTKQGSCDGGRKLSAIKANKMRLTLSTLAQNLILKIKPEINFDTQNEAEIGPAETSEVNTSL
jgi:hypothetical protein